MNKTFMEYQVQENKEIFKKGYIALLTVLVVGAIATSVVLLLFFLGTTSLKNTKTVEEHFYSKAYSESCAEKALQQIRDSVSFSGSANFSFSQGSCSYEVFNLTGQNRRIEAEGISNGSVNRIVILIDEINPEINVVSWNDVDDF